MKHKIIPMILCLLLCMAFTPAAAFADNAKTAPVGIWTDYAAGSFAGGTGTKEDPYKIETPEQLAKLAKEVNSGVYGQTHNKEYFKLTEDLDLSAHRWIPIGTGTTTTSFHSFFGYFNGNSKIITGMYVDESESKENAGLFGNVTGILLENITIKNGYVKANTANGNNSDGAGILIGSATVGGNPDLETKVQNCSVNGIVENVNGRAGGLAGYNSYGSYENCTADVTINGAGKAGGFVGEEFSGKYKDCVAKGNVNGFWSVGGFAGVLFFESKVEHCASYGKVTATNWNCGGFAGYIENGVKISECVAFSDVESKVDGFEPNAGGFAGTVNGTNGGNTISNSHAAGNITMASSDYKAGGFAATLMGSNSFNSCSFDVEKNAGIKAKGGKEAEAADIEGVSAGSTQAVKANICRDYDHKHDELRRVLEKPATCTEDGYKAYVICDACGTMYDAESDLMTIIDNPEVIKATGHEFGEWKVTKEATATEKGEKERTCSKCQLVEKAEIPAIGTTGTTDPAKDTKDNTDKSAATGDDSNPALYGILALLAAGGAAGTLYRRRKA